MTRKTNPPNSRRMVSRLAILCAAAALSACEAPTQSPGQADAPLLYNGLTPNIAPNADPAELVGLNSDIVNDLLGAPALTRREGGAEVWQYRSDICVLDVFLYGGPKQVEHVDLRDRAGASEPAVRACFTRMLNGKIPTS